MKPPMSNEMAQFDRKLIELTRIINKIIFGTKVPSQFSAKFIKFESKSFYFLCVVVSFFGILNLERKKKI